MFTCLFDVYTLHLYHNLKSIIIMKTNYLFPNQFKKIGWSLFIPGIILGIVFMIYQSDISIFNIKVLAIAEEEIFRDTTFFSISKNNVLDEITSILLIIGALLIAFSKEKSEDEFISKIRLESLVWATYMNYAILILAIIFVFNMTFLWVLVFNMFTLLVFFLVHFNWALYKSKNQIRDEE